MTHPLSEDLPLQWEHDADDDTAWAAFGVHSDSVMVSPVPDQAGKYSVDVDPPYVGDLETGKQLAEAMALCVSGFFSSTAGASQNEQ